MTGSFIACFAGVKYTSCRTSSTSCLHQVYQEFEITSQSNDPDGPFNVETPRGGYSDELYSNVTQVKRRRACAVMTLILTAEPQQLNACACGSSSANSDIRSGSLAGLDIWQGIKSALLGRPFQAFTSRLQQYDRVAMSCFTRIYVIPYMQVFVRGTCVLTCACTQSCMRRRYETSDILVLYWEGIRMPGFTQSKRE